MVKSGSVLLRRKTQDERRKYRYMTVLQSFTLLLLLTLVNT
jgi:hypothetical protein